MYKPGPFQEAFIISGFIYHNGLKGKGQYIQMEIVVLVFYPGSIFHKLSFRDFDEPLGLSGTP
jgi:hypothetical protein